MKATEMLHILKVQNKRLFIIWLVTFIAFVGMLGYTIYLLNDIGVEETTATQWCNEYGISQTTLNDRLKRGWTLEQALTISTKGFHRKVNK